MHDQAEATLPHRLKPALAYFFPATVMPWWALSIQAGAATIAASFLSMPSAMQWLFYSVCADMFTGLACAFFTRGGFLARTITRGATKKTLAFILVAALHRSKITVDLAGVVMDIGTAAASWYLVGECISIAENLDELDVPLPPFVRQALAKARAAMGKRTIPKR